MYQFYYEKFQPFWGQNLKLHYIDTDSFVLSIKTDNLVKDLEHFKEDFDFSDLDKSHQLYSDVNKKVIGKFKIETLPHLEIDEFCCLRSKSYTYKVNEKEISKQKGVQKLNTLDDYKRSLFFNETTNQTNFSIRTNHHQLNVISQNKMALNPFDDKRLYLNNINQCHGTITPKKVIVIVFCVLNLLDYII